MAAFHNEHDNTELKQIVRAAKGIGGARGKYKNRAAIVRRGSGGTPPRNYNALKCILRFSEAPFRARIQYIHTYLQVLLPPSFSSVRKLSTMYTGP